MRKILNEMVCRVNTNTILLQYIIWRVSLKLLFTLFWVCTAGASFVFVLFHWVVTCTFVHASTPSAVVSPYLLACTALQIYDYNCNDVFGVCLPCLNPYASDCLFVWYRTPPNQKYKLYTSDCKQYGYTLLSYCCIRLCTYSITLPVTIQHSHTNVLCRLVSRTTYYGDCCICNTPIFVCCKMQYTDGWLLYTYGNITLMWPRPTSLLESPQR
jgi:hypothetical protein